MSLFQMLFISARGSKRKYLLRARLGVLCASGTNSYSLWEPDKKTKLSSWIIGLISTSFQAQNHAFDKD